MKERKFTTHALTYSHTHSPTPLLEPPAVQAPPGLKRQSRLAMLTGPELLCDFFVVRALWSQSLDRCKGTLWLRIDWFLWYIGLWYIVNEQNYLYTGCFIKKICLHLFFNSPVTTCIFHNFTIKLYILPLLDKFSCSGVVEFDEKNPFRLALVLWLGLA